MRTREASPTTWNPAQKTCRCTIPRQTYCGEGPPPQLHRLAFGRLAELDLGGLHHAGAPALIGQAGQERAGAAVAVLGPLRLRAAEGSERAWVHREGGWQTHFVGAPASRPATHTLHPPTYLRHPPTYPRNARTHTCTSTAGHCTGTTGALNSASVLPRRGKRARSAQAGRGWQASHLPPESPAWPCAARWAHGAWWRVSPPQQTALPAST
jgi:hypothetical protein